MSKNKQTKKKKHTPGTYQHAKDEQQLNSLNIEYVLDVEEGGSKPQNLQPTKYKAVPISDFGYTQLSQVLDECFEFLEHVRQQGASVLVQCEWGINRSSTVVLGYLVKHHGYTLRDAMIFVKSRRKIIEPRTEYKQQLSTLEQTIWRPNAEPESYLTQADIDIIFQPYFFDDSDKEE